MQSKAENVGEITDDKRLLIVNALAHSEHKVESLATTIKPTAGLGHRITETEDEDEDSKTHEIKETVVVVVVHCSNMKHMLSACKRHPWSWVTVFEPRLTREETLRSILKDADISRDISTPKVEADQLVQIFCIVEEIWGEELGRTPHRSQYEAVVHTLQLLSQAALRTSSSTLASISTALETLEQAKKVVETSLPSAIEFQKEKVDILKEILSECKSRSTHEIDGAEKAESKQKQHVTSIMLKYEDTVRNKTLAAALRDAESNKAMAEAEALIQNCNLQTMKREIGKAISGASSLQPQRNLIFGVCKILGIKRATKPKKKKLKKKKGIGIMPIDLPTVLANQLFEKLGQARTVADYCVDKAVLTPPVIAQSCPVLKKRGSRTAGSTKVNVTWSYLHKWALATVAFAEAEHINQLKQTEFQVVEKELKEEKENLASRQIFRAEITLELKKKCSSAESDVVEAVSCVLELEKDLERSQRFVNSLIPTVSGRWHRQLNALNREHPKNSKKSTSSIQIPDDMMRMLVSVSLCLLGPLSEKARRSCRSRWLLCLFRYLGQPQDVGDSGVTKEMMDFFENTITSHMIASLFLNQVSSASQLSSRNTTVHTLASFVVGWSSRSMNIDNLTSLCISSYWGSKAIIVDPDGHMQWLFEKYDGIKHAVQPRRKERLGAPTFIRVLSDVSEESISGKEFHIVANTFHKNRSWLRYRLARSADEVQAQGSVQRKSARGKKKRNININSKLDSEKHALVDLNVLSENHTLASNILFNGMEELLQCQIKLGDPCKMFAAENEDSLERMVGSVQSLAQLDLRRKHLQRELEQNLSSTNNSQAIRDDGYVSRTANIFLALRSGRLPNIVHFDQLQSIMVDTLTNRNQKRSTTGIDKTIIKSCIQWICRCMHEQNALLAMMHVCKLVVESQGSQEEWQVLFLLPELIQSIKSSPSENQPDHTLLMPQWMSGLSFQLCSELTKRVHVLRKLLTGLLDPGLEHQWKSHINCENSMKTFHVPHFDGCVWSHESGPKQTIRRLLLCIALQPNRCLFYFRWFARNTFGADCFDHGGHHLYGLECEAKSVRQLLSFSPTAPMHISCDNYGIDGVSQVLAAGRPSGFDFNCVVKIQHRVLPPGSLPVAIRSVFELNSLRKDYSAFVQLTHDFIRTGGWIVLADIQVEQNHVGLHSLLSAIVKAGKSNAVHPKFRLMLLSSNNVKHSLLKKAVRPISSDECRISLEADHNSFCHSILRHYMHGYTYKPSNDRRVRRLYFAATYFHAALCSAYPSSSILTNCPYGASDFQFMLFLLERFLGGSNIRVEDVHTIFREVLQTTYTGHNNTILVDCIENVFGDVTSSSWPTEVPEKAAGSRVAALEWASTL